MPAERWVDFPSPVSDARFLRRYQRFFAEAVLKDGTVVIAHCANPGSMLGVLRPGASAYLSPAGPGRSLGWSLEALRVGRIWVGVHPVRANRVVETALAAGAVAPLTGYARRSREPWLDRATRSDFLLEGGRRRRCWVEVKNVTLARGSLGLFPDSVTLRGRRHLAALLGRVRAGDRAVLLLIASRGDVLRVGPADGIDPAYGSALREAIQGGVEVLGYRMRVSRRGLALDQQIPVDPGPHPFRREDWPTLSAVGRVAPERSTT